MPEIVGINNKVIQGTPRSLYYGPELAAQLADFGPSDGYFVLFSKRLATDILAGLGSYDSALLKRGLLKGWLQLIVNPTLWEIRSDKLQAVGAMKKAEAIPDGWYRMLIVPRWGSKNGL